MLSEMEKGTERTAKAGMVIQGKWDYEGTRKGCKGVGRIIGRKDRRS